MEFLLNLQWYWYLIIVLAIVTIVLLCVQFKGFRKIVRNLVIEAEEQIKGTKKGQERFAYVVNLVHQYVPKPLKWYFTEIRIAEWIENAVTCMKNKLEN